MFFGTPFSCKVTSDNRIDCLVISCPAGTIGNTIESGCTCGGTTYEYLFDGCPRWYRWNEGSKGAGGLKKASDAFTLDECQKACTDDVDCTVFEINGCLRNSKNCGGACWLFAGGWASVIHRMEIAK